jgi:CPA2 family monovalent cation:H+ antiporter-2
MRTRYLGERERLFALGAKEVVAEEVEGAVEIVTRMLRRAEVPEDAIDARIREVRSDTRTEAQPA